MRVGSQADHASTPCTALGLVVIHNLVINVMWGEKELNLREVLSHSALMNIQSIR